MSKFDLSKYETIDVATLTVKNPKGGDLLGVDDKPVTINLYGMGSKQYIAAKRKLDNANQMRSLAMVRNNKIADPKEVEASENEFLAAITESVENFPLDPLEIYSNPKLSYIRSQVDKFASETENFMPS